MESLLAEACLYALLPPGKCVRPALTLLVAECLELQRSLLEPFAAAVEMVHTASLIHDDLPALDDDTMRRGRPSVHRHYGEATAILAGDALFAAASVLVLRNQPGLELSQRLTLVEVLNQAVVSICQGQVYDLQAAGKIPADPKTHPPLTPEAELLRRHRLKTGALIETAVLAPAYIAGYGPQSPIFSALKGYAENLGLLFQVTDDLLEASGSATELGKDADSDARKGIPTFLSVHGEVEAQRLADSIAATANAALNGYPQLEPLQEVVELVRCRRN